MLINCGAQGLRHSLTLVERSVHRSTKGPGCLPETAKPSAIVHNIAIQTAGYSANNRRPPGRSGARLKEQAREGTRACSILSSCSAPFIRGFIYALSGVERRFSRELGEPGIALQE